MKVSKPAPIVIDLTSDSEEEVVTISKSQNSFWKQPFLISTNGRQRINNSQDESSELLTPSDDLFQHSRRASLHHFWTARGEQEIFSGEQIVAMTPRPRTYRALPGRRRSEINKWQNNVVFGDPLPHLASGSKGMVLTVFTCVLCFNTKGSQSY